MGWVAHLEVEKRNFQLISDRGYIDVYEVIDGQRQHILPPDEQRLSITPGQIRALLTESVG